MTYVDIRDQAVEQIKTAFQGREKIHIAAHPGRFNEAEIKRLANQTPAILTSLVRCADGGNDSITLVSWVLYRASAVDKLYDGALRIVSALIPALRNADFDLVIKDTEIEAECLYSGSLDAINITLWAVRWELRLAQRAIGDDGGLCGEALYALETFDGYDGEAKTGPLETIDNVNLED